ncbi:MAG: glycosyltransferase family 4 protein [Sumerlaeia bacterium]
MKKKLMFLNFHPAFNPPKSGGELRYWNLATRVAKDYSVKMLNPTFGDAQPEAIQHAPDCLEYRFPKAKAYNAWHHFFDRWAGFQECSGLVSLLAANQDSAYRKAVRKAATAADVVVHSSPFVYPVYPKARKGQFLVYDSYNVESRLAKESFKTGRWPLRNLATRFVALQERKLCKQADLILCCSSEDADFFASDYGIGYEKMIVIPNGVNTGELQPPTQEQRAAARRNLNILTKQTCLFFGSFHPPNLEALQFIVNVLAPMLPEVEFLIAGNVCKEFAENKIPNNVRLFGLVSEDIKLDLLRGTDLALNPMFSGSGTNLKMLEYLAMGLAIITTSFGARGLNLKNDIHGSVIESKYFTKAIQDLLADPAKRALYAQNARRKAESEFDWNTIAQKFLDVTKMRTSPRVLMLNDYPISPVAAGGQIRLHALGAYLSRKGNNVLSLTFTNQQNGAHTLHNPQFEEINLPRGTFQRFIDRLVSAAIGVSADDITLALVSKYAPVKLFALLPNSVPVPAAVKLYRIIAKQKNYILLIILNHSYMVSIGNKFTNSIPVFYESHNVEYLLKHKLYPQKWLGRFLVKEARKLEKTAIHLSPKITTVSQEDANMFAQEFSISAKQIIVSPNGVDCTLVTPATEQEKFSLRKKVGLGNEPIFIFLGSGHPPNADAARFILHELCWHFPEATFLILGSVNGWFHSEKIPENIIFTGVVESGVKDYLLRIADVALNPLLAGSGSSLKVPEYLRAGLPVVSTELGARGFIADEGHGIYTSSLQLFHEPLDQLLKSKSLRLQASAAARKAAVLHYDWAKTLEPMGKLVEELIGSPDTYTKSGIEKTPQKSAPLL